MVSQKPREIAAQILLRHGSGRAYIEDLVDSELAGRHLNSLDRALIQELCYGVVRWRLTLDWLIQRQIRDQAPSPPAQALLRLGLYQLFCLDRVPPHAAVNETVEAARALDLGPQAGFVNAVLRNYARSLEPTRTILADLRHRDPAIGWSHPPWLVNRWKKHHSPEDLQTLLAWNNTPAETFARVNTLKTDAHQLIEAWRKEGVEYDFGRWDWIDENLVFRLRRHPALERLETLRSGWFYVQDPSTLLAVQLLAPRPTETILDSCAAPGGKATFIAQCLDNDGRIVALESDPARRRRLRQNCERLAADVDVRPPEDLQSREEFDGILVDAPCSNTGVLRRRLDARWRLRVTDLERFGRLQSRLLTDGLNRLAPRGRLVYSTCSLEPEENATIVQSVLAGRPESRWLKVDCYTPRGNEWTAPLLP